MSTPDKVFRFVVTRVEITTTHEEATVEVTAPDAKTAADYANDYARGHEWENVKLTRNWVESDTDTTVDRTDTRRLLQGEDEDEDEDDSSPLTLADMKKGYAKCPYCGSIAYPDVIARRECCDYDKSELR